MCKPIVIVQLVIFVSPYVFRIIVQVNEIIESMKSSITISYNEYL